MGAIAGTAFLAFFSAVNAYLWGDGGDMVHLLGFAVPAYSLAWIWIGMIAIIYGFNYGVHGVSDHRVCHIIATWWTANIAMTTVLNSISFRGVEEAGESIFGNSGLIMDFTVQGALDLAALAIIWFLIRKGILSASAWTLVFCGFLVANLFGHTAGAYNLLIGVSADTTAQGYDSYMYLVFTIMLIIQVSGAGLDAWLRWSDSEVDIYVDLRPFISRFTARHLHLH